MAQTFFTDEEIGNNYLLDSILTIVDAKHAKETLDEYHEAQEQVGFAEQFGRVEDTPTLVDQGRRRLANMKINDISNLAADGQIFDREDRRRMYNLGNMLWHSDSSFKPTPAKYSMLHARVIPPTGGETEYVDTRVAWEELPQAMKDTVKDLVIRAAAMSIGISLLVWLYNLSPGDQPWVVFGALGGLALSRCCKDKLVSRSGGGR